MAELNRKAKGDLAELRVACDLRRRGYKIALPYGEDWDYDLILCRAGQLERVQVKYTRSNEEVVTVKCFSDSLTNGRVRVRKHYTADTVDWIAVFDATTDRCFYLRSSELEGGKTYLSLRLKPSRNGQSAGVRPASSYAEI